MILIMIREDSSVSIFSIKKWKAKSSQDIQTEARNCLPASFRFYNVINLLFLE